MLVTKVTSFLALAACAVAARSAKQTLSDIDSLTNNVGSLNNALKNYHGGMVQAIPVAQALRDTTQDVRNARAHVEGEETFSDADAMEARKAWEQLAPAIEEVTRLAIEKAPEFKKAGLGSQAKQMLDDLDEERRGLSQDMRRMSETEFQNFKPTNDRIDNSVDELLHTFNN